PVRVPALILVTDRRATGGRDLLEVVAAALDAGLPAVQLRDKDLPGRPLLALAERLRAATVRTGALLFVNDRVDVAIAVGADGVHLGHGALPAAAARRLLPGGAGCAFSGRVWDPPGKAAAGPARLAEAVAAAAVPVLAIGGVTAERVPA